MKKNITVCAFTNYLSLQRRAYSRDLLDNFGFGSWRGRGGGRGHTLQSNFRKVCSARPGGGLGEDNQITDAVLSSLHKVCTIVSDTFFLQRTESCKKHVMLC